MIRSIEAPRSAAGPHRPSSRLTAATRAANLNAVGSVEDARAFCDRFFHWYNEEHYHFGIGLHHPADVHYGRARLIPEQRATVLDVAYSVHPDRFVRKALNPADLPTSTWINKPPKQEPPSDNSTNP